MANKSEERMKTNQISERLKSLEQKEAGEKWRSRVGESIEKQSLSKKTDFLGNQKSSRKLLKINT